MLPPTVTDAPVRARDTSPVSSWETTVRLAAEMVSSSPAPKPPLMELAVMVTSAPDWLTTALAAAKAATSVPAE